MAVVSDNPDLHRIVVLNSKGGSGKTTLAFNIAGYLARLGRSVALVDMDPQGSSSRWLRNRSDDLTPIIGIRPSSRDDSVADSPTVEVPPEIEYAVVDAPAGLSSRALIDYTCGAHAILLPVLPSDLDIHAASRLISQLLLVAKVSRRNGRLGIVANRVKVRTIAYRQLRKFLDRLSITVVGTLRDSQNYTWAAANGLCIYEMGDSRAAHDLEQWGSIAAWLEARLATPLTPRDWLRPTQAIGAAPAASPATRRSRVGGWAVAATVAIVVVGWLQWQSNRSLNRESAQPAVATAPADAEQVVSVASIAASQTAPRALGPVDVVVADNDVTAGEQLLAQWQLSGIVRSGALNIVTLEDRHGPATRSVTENVDVDGWVVADAGSNFAVLEQNGERVRFDLTDR